MSFRSIIVIGFLALTSCLPTDNGSVVPANDSVSPVPDFAGYNFKKLDGSELTLPTDENIILACLPNNEICSSICVSQAFPSEVRYSINRTGFLVGNKCQVYVMGHTDENGFASLRFYEGSHDGQNCNGIDIENPDLTGFFDVAEIRVPEGQTPPIEANGKMLYYQFNLLSSEQAPLGSYILQSYEPVPASNAVYSFSYINQDLNLTPTFLQVNGFTCVQENELQVN